MNMLTLNIEEVDDSEMSQQCPLSRYIAGYPAFMAAEVKLTSAY
jgi:hypothetical protein